jgi:hypothetical protein
MRFGVTRLAENRDVRFGVVGCVPIAVVPLDVDRRSALATWADVAIPPERAGSAPLLRDGIPHPGVMVFPCAGSFRDVLR